MSADNWETCPRCRDEAGIYAGGLSLQTFREDYEWWLSDDDEGTTLNWKYKGGCTECGLSIEKRGSERFYERTGATHG